jgi:hypothetical protein
MDRQAGNEAYPDITTHQVYGATERAREGADSACLPVDTDPGIIQFPFKTNIWFFHLTVGADTPVLLHMGRKRLLHASPVWGRQVARRC